MHSDTAEGKYFKMKGSKTAISKMKKKKKKKHYLLVENNHALHQQSTQQKSKVRPRPTSWLNMLNP